MSIGSTAALSVMMSAYLMVVSQANGIEAILFCLFIGALAGLFNGFLIVKIKIPDMLATLGTMFLIQGLQLIPSAGRSIGNGAVLEGGVVAKGQYEPYFLWLGQGRIFNLIPVAVIIMVIVAILVFIILSLTRWGRVFYAIGSNAQAARLVGAKVDQYRILAYVISGLIAAVGGIILSARVGRGDVQAGGNLLLDSIASALIGLCGTRGKEAESLWNNSGGHIYQYAVKWFVYVEFSLFCPRFYQGCGVSRRPYLYIWPF